MMKHEIKLTPEQTEIVRELCDTHGLDPSQISFDDDGRTPIFDYEAVSALSLKLTDIKSIDCSVPDRERLDRRVAVAVCTVILPDGRTRTVEDACVIGEENPATRCGVMTLREAEGLAQNRAVRRGIRSVGINLWNAHRTFKQTGEIACGSTDLDPREALRKQIHVLRDEIGYSVDEYQAVLEGSFNGRGSSNDLNDLELQSAIRLFQALLRIKRSRERFAKDETLKQAA